MRIGPRSKPLSLRKHASRATVPTEAALRGALRVLLWVVLCSMVAEPAPARGQGIIEGFSGDVETQYNLFTSKTTEGSGTTRKTQVNNLINTVNLRLNYDLLPTLNLNTGVAYQSNISDPAGDEAGVRTELTRLRPYVWMTLRDTTYTGAVGYDLQRQSLKPSGLPEVTLNQESLNANLNWNPTGLPSLQFLLRRTNTYDDERSSQDKTEDYVFVKPEYVYGGLDVYYAGTYLKTDDKVLNFDSTQWSHEGRLLYSKNFLDNRIAFTTDNRVRFTEINTTTAGQGEVSAPVIPVAGLSAPSNIPQNVTLAPNPNLIDGNLTAAAGPDSVLVIPALGGDTRPRNLGLDFLAPVELNRLDVWVRVTDSSGSVVTLPQNIASLYLWEIYTSTDNINWSRFRLGQSAPFGPLDPRFEIDFPSVRTRYIKVVVSPLSETALATTTVNQISVTEIQASVTAPAQSVSSSLNQTFQNYTLDLKAILFRTPSLYYNFNGYYFQFDPSGQQRYNISNGLYFNHQLTSVFTTSANASVEFGSEGDQTRTALLYYAALTAIPFKTLTNSLVFNGNNEFIGGRTNMTNGVVLYNTAQLYKGIDAILNLGANFITNEVDNGGSLDRRELYMNVGAGITPHPNLTMNLYYTGKLTYFTGDLAGRSSDATENRLDFTLSFTPVRTLFLFAGVNVASATRQDTAVQQTYGLNWAPFPDGSLQFSFYFVDNYYPDRSRIIQPTLRWYPGLKRRSYFEFSYQYNDTETGSQQIESQTFTATLKIFF